MKVCVIGAGSSGLPAIKALADEGLEVTAFERGERVGGNWVFGNANGMSSAYRSLHINTSKGKMAYADFPMPERYPDFPHHSLIAAYFERYAEHFELHRHIRFRTTVTRAERQAEGGWLVTSEDASGESAEQHFDALMVANGHHWDPHLPAPPFPGALDGVTFHSHHYIDPQTPHDLRGKRVVVLGMGNSAMDIACELSRPGVAERVYLSCRRGAWVVPKYLFGRPLDEAGGLLPHWLPFPIRRGLFSLGHRLTVGRMSDFGLPEPDHAMGHAHPTVSSDLLPRLGQGDILVRPNIAELKGDTVRFEDGQEDAVDAIVYCTGYNVTFPFFDDAWTAELFPAIEENDVPLYKRVFAPAYPDLAFIGLCQPLGAIMPLAEEQSKWAAELFAGKAALPSPEAMEADMKGERRRMFQRYVASRRHTMQVDFDVYLRELQRERKKGRRQLSAQQRTPGVSPSRV